MTTTLGQLYLQELEAEAAATRKCLERIPEHLFDWKPHEKSMQLGYLALLVADIPNGSPRSLRWGRSTLRRGRNIPRRR